VQKKLHELAPGGLPAGGEPTLPPELTRIVARMRELRVSAAQLITTGISSPGFIESLKKRGEAADLQITVEAEAPTGHP